MLKTRLKEFKLSGIYNTLGDRLALAKNKSLSYQEYADSIGADGYASNVSSAVDLAEQLLKRT